MRKSIFIRKLDIQRKISIASTQEVASLRVFFSINYGKDARGRFRATNEPCPGPL